MRYIKLLFDFYIQSSIHVALAVYALVQMTNHMFSLAYDLPIALFAFFGTVLGYNFVKYEAVVVARKKNISLRMKCIILISLFSVLIIIYSFFQLEAITQAVAVVFLVFTLLYTLPFFPNRKNIRNWRGVKIYMVAFCWAGITIIIPLLNVGSALSDDAWLKFMQRFLLVIILILIFEIIDLKHDDLSLHTVPQQIGVDKTKLLILLLLVPFYSLEFLQSKVNTNQLWINLVMVIVTGLFTIKATPDRSKYYTTFWVESIPVFWWGMVVLYG